MQTRGMVQGRFFLIPLFILGVLFAPRSFASSEVKPPIFFISDNDDTLEISGIKIPLFHPIQKASTYFSFRAYTGTALLYQILHKKGVRFIYLSGSLQRLKPVLTAWLSAHGFPPGLIIQRASWSEDVGDFKTRAMLRLLPELSQAEVFAFGDDGEKDSQAYGRIQRLVKNMTVFIRSPYGNPLQAEAPQTRVLPTLELAVHLFQKGILTESELLAVSHETSAALLAGDYEDIYPGFSHLESETADRMFELSRLPLPAEVSATLHWLGSQAQVLQEQQNPICTRVLAL